MREKLIELLCEAMQTDDCVGHCDSNCGRVETTADHLIANGVTVRDKGEWNDSGRLVFEDGSKAIVHTECGCALTEKEYSSFYWNFCPLCGADMRKGAEHDA